MAQPTDPFVTAQWLADNPHAIVADVRWYLDGRPARPIFEAGHLPGARFVDLDTDLSAAGGTNGRHPLPAPAIFSAAMQRLGVSADSTVVAYDDTGGVTAGRLWWMLDSVGVEAYVLSGGIAAWAGDLESGSGELPAAGDLVVGEWSADRFTDSDEVLHLVNTGAADAGNPVVLDARSPERYTGVENAIDPRFGHVPGARNAPALANLDDGLPRSTDALTDHYRSHGVDRDTPVVAYCGSGVSACLDLLALRRIGLRDTRLYVGSWSEWGADPSKPIRIGESS